jgi:septum formation protein
MRPQVILASQSPYRRAQLTQFGVKFEAVKPLADEEALKASGPKDLFELTRYLAFEKARSLSAKYPAALILGSDQLADLEGRRLDKPGTRERAFQQLKAMSGREHRLITSLALLMGEKSLIFTDVTRLRMKNLSDRDIEAYLDKDEPYDCAGSYKIEKAGLGLVDAIETSDASAIQGLPLLSLARGLEQMGLSLAGLWSEK